MEELWKFALEFLGIIFGGLGLGLLAITKLRAMNREEGEEVNILPQVDKMEQEIKDNDTKIDNSSFDDVIADANDNYGNGRKPEDSKD